MFDIEDFGNKVNKLAQKDFCAMSSNGIGNAICIVGFEYDVDDYVRFYRIDGDEWGKTVRAKIQYTKKDGKPFFISRGKRIFLENFLKTY